MWCFTWLRWFPNWRLGPRRVVVEIWVLSRAKEERKARRRRSRHQETFLFKESETNLEIHWDWLSTRISFLHFLSRLILKGAVGYFHFSEFWPQSVALQQSFEQPQGTLEEEQFFFSQWCDGKWFVSHLRFFLWTSFSQKNTLWISI